MDKRALQSYAVWAKNNLENQIEVSLKTLGINSEKDIKEARRVGEYTIIDGDSNSYPGDLKNKRDSIVRLIQTDGYKQVIEEFAYTWFNRIVALRFMEVHDFLPHGFRVLSSRDGGFEPEILKNVAFLKNDLKLDVDHVNSLKSQGKIDEAYRYVLFRQCKALSGILPMLFNEDSDYLELLLPKALLKGETFITKLMEIGEEDFLNDVEVMGWLYQFYISQKKDAVFASKEIITKDTLPAVTQLFTPDWIVRYMAENSVGRIWMESYPNSALKSAMKYFVDAEEDNSASVYKNVNPEELRIIEPCCGSGHILVYIFDLLYKMYEEHGYQAREIPTLILKNNLVGLDVDRRAAQLAAFSLVMKARSKNARFFNSTYYIEPQVYDIWDARAAISSDYKKQIEDLHLLNSEQIKEIEWLVETFRHGKTIGSLLKIDSRKNLAKIKESLDLIDSTAVHNLFNGNFLNEGMKCLYRLVRQAEILASKYDALVTNPPYRAVSSMEQVVKDYAVAWYGNSKTDLFSMFIENSFSMTKAAGYSAFMTPYTWMFIKSYQLLREEIVSKKHMQGLIQLEYSAFEEATVPICTFVLRNLKNNQCGTFFRLTEFLGGMAVQEAKFLEALKCDVDYKYLRSTDSFELIEGMPLSYWINEEGAKAFKEKNLAYYTDPKCGLKTGITEKYVLTWQEVSFADIGFGFGDRPSAQRSGKKWFPVSDGQEFRKWYGNNYDVVYWHNDGYEIRHLYCDNGKLKSRPQNMDYYFKPCLTWSALTSKALSLRYSPVGNIISGAGYGLFSSDKVLLPIMAVLNSSIAKYYASCISETLNFEVGVLAKIPIHKNIFDNTELVDLVQENIALAKTEWDNYEISFEFSKHPLIGSSRYLENCFENWSEYAKQRYERVSFNEDRINQILIDAYDVADSINYIADDTEITLRFASKEVDIKSLISYLVGVEMGRYSLDVEGIAFAGGEWNPMKYVTYQPDNDGIIPVYTQLGMQDGLTARIIRLIKHIYGEDTYRENIDFIAEALGKNTNESSEETLNRYLNEGFYADHVKMYQKRPIYWMFSSGKSGAFKCLVYLHRYSEDTLAIINSKYFLNESARINAEVEETRLLLEAAEGREKLRLEKLYKSLTAKQKEMLEYGQVLDHMANQYIPLDLDDGVKVNYAKFQDIEIVNDNGVKVKKDLLVPIK